MLKRTVKKILENADFQLVDTEVNIDIDDDGNSEFSIDVCALEKDTLFVFQCKDVGTLSSPKKEMNSTKEYIRKVLSGEFKVLESDTGNISDEILNKITEIKCCYVFTKQLSNKKMKDNVETAEFLFWNDQTVKYYRRISGILRHLTKNEILKEFNIEFSTRDTHEENAVQIKQEDNVMYLVGMHPGLLLKIAYVYRRTGKKPDAYQRIITKDRIDNISKFFNESENLLLPNPVIIVFDEDQTVQDKIKYKKGVLQFPVKYCSAWIIDGQHRIYGFKDHPKYKDWKPGEEDDFKIPVVVFDTLPFIEQNKTFLNINYYQKKIDPILFNDLSTVIKDLRHEITWPSLLVSELNKKGPWKDMIKISELDAKKPITISGFAKTVLLLKLLGYNKKTKIYSGNLYKIAPFNPEKPFDSKENQIAFKKQISLLNRFFTIVREKIKDEDPKQDKWSNSKEYGLTKFTSVNAFLLVLDKLLEKDPRLSMNLNQWLSVIKTIDFKNESLLEYGRGYPAMPKIANKIIRLMNSRHGAKLTLI